MRGLSLRARLALILVATGVILIGGLLWLRHEVAFEDFDAATRTLALNFLADGGAERCRQNPTGFAPHLGHRGRPLPRGRERERGERAGPRLQGPRGFRLWAYAADFHSHNPDAPPMPRGIEQALRRGADMAGEDSETDGRPGRRLAFPTPYDEAASPLVYILAERPVPPSTEGHDTLWFGAGAAIVLLLLIVLLALGPVVARIRRLTHHLEAEAAGARLGDLPIEGNDELTRLAETLRDYRRELAQGGAELAARERALREFVSDTVHDVMIPITVLQGHLTRLQERQAMGFEVDTERLRSATEEAHYVACLISNLSTAAKLQSGGDSITLHKQDLREVVERAVARHAPMARSRSISLHHGVPEDAVRVQGDVTLLEQAVGNLVHNAVRYNHEGGNVAVVLEQHEGGRAFEIRVQDDGPGIPANEIPRVTNRRYRGADARTRRPGGGGLGLHIVKDVVERHGFELELCGREPRGLRVSIKGRTDR